VDEGRAVDAEVSEVAGESGPATATASSSPAPAGETAESARLSRQHRGERSRQERPTGVVGRLLGAVRSLFGR
jgi:3-oxoacyl-ACP reductase-like protein